VAVNKSELVEAVASSADLDRKQAESAITAFVDTVIGESGRGNKVSIFGFGTFTPTARAARTGRNPQTGAPVKIAASKGVRFAPAQAFKATLNPKSGTKKAGGTKAAAKTGGSKSGGSKTGGSKSGGSKSGGSKSGGSKSTAAKTSAAGKTLAKASTAKAPPAKKVTSAAKTLGTAGGKSSAPKQAAAKKAAKSTKKR
jgi:DNA-binding protein HU-beta